VADYLPVYEDGTQPFTATTSAAVTGGRVVRTSGNGTVAHAGAAAADAVGVAAHDAASGAEVAVWPLEGVVHELEAASAITAGGGIQTAAAGQVDPATTSIAAASAAGTLIGRATTTAAGSPLKVRFVGSR
jgi:Uncharacterized conserved protein (DUF2190)